MNKKLEDLKEKLNQTVQNSNYDLDEILKIASKIERN